MLQNPPLTIHKHVMPHCKKPTRIQAHLVFPTLNADTEKPKEPEFLPTPQRRLKKNFEKKFGDHPLTHPIFVA